MSSVSSKDQSRGLALACSSAAFIAVSFILKKRGLRLSATTGLRAGSGGYSYLAQPLWWLGMLSMVVGELANFAAYAFAPAILVTPLGALSIIISAVLAHLTLGEKLNTPGVLGCALCILGSTVVVLHAPLEAQITSPQQIWVLARQPGFLLYATAALAGTCALIFYVAPLYGTSSVFVYLGICSLAGSLTVTACKALGISLRLVLAGQASLLDAEVYFSALVVACCVVVQINYLNRALDTFSTAVVSPIYYVLFTTLTICASTIMFQEKQDGFAVVNEVCGFLTIVIGTYLLQGKDHNYSPGPLEVELGLAGRQLRQEV